ncbi:DUF4235 domain-containing protein [Bifidobacterium felsineum]|uniref:DUF4235 domain-containing protein n=1 Tax=Bifidobacterium felsineum TaxID=2045440 RepID=A0A2M9HII6_9BIFI|nr:DUF4235 domain-containing protein [Bifidobacterium felsineum]MBT1164872.1 DUF4235 domain-containing protein [Bifidobacterium felsineum]PJM76597.1 hypothetical protein CSQ86_08965 [Bifidobacterium felsineum]
MSDETNSALSGEADQMIEGLHHIDDAVNAAREHRLNDPDSLGDKFIKSAVPALTGLIAGKAFQTVWNHGVAHRNLRKGLAADAPQGLLLSLAFAAVSAAFGAVVSQLSDRGSQAFVERRHRKAKGK